MENEGTQRKAQEYLNELGNRIVDVRDVGDYPSAQMRANNVHEKQGNTRLMIA